MTSFASRAWNPRALAVRPSTLVGGLFVNYRPSWDGSGNAEINTNIRTNGESDAQAHVAPRHDPLTDLIVLRDLDVLLSIGVRNDQLDTLRCDLQPVTEAEFSSYGPPRGWVYQQLVDLSKLDPAGPWGGAARRFAGSLARTYVNGLPDGPSFRPDWVAESASALVDAGGRFSTPEWLTTGRELALQLCRTSADPHTGLFPGQLTLGRSGALVKDVLVKVGAEAQLFDGLLATANATHVPLLLAAVRKGLNSLTSPSLGLVDHVNGGVFYAIDANGARVRTSYKETRQAWLVPLFNDAAAAGLLPASDATDMMTVVRDRLYQRDINGFVYRVMSNWTPFSTSHNGAYVGEDWISSEATGIAVQALLGKL